MWSTSGGGVPAWLRGVWPVGAVGRRVGWGGGWVLEGEADVGRLVAVFDPSSYAERADAGMLLVWWGEDMPA